MHCLTAWGHASLLGGTWQCNSSNTLLHCRGAPGVQLLLGTASCTASLPGGSGQRESCNASLPWGSGQCNSCNTLLQCTASLLGGSGQWNSCTRACTVHTASRGSGHYNCCSALTAWGGGVRGQWAVQLCNALQLPRGSTSSLPGGSGRKCNSCAYTATLPGGSGEWNCTRHNASLPGGTAATMLHLPEGSG